MPIGFAIFITAVIVSVVVLLIYHYVILGTTGGLVDPHNPGGYNYDENIQYINARLGSMVSAIGGGIPYNPPPLPDGEGSYAPYP
jgi:hypothetical protein